MAKEVDIMAGLVKKLTPMPLDEPIYPDRVRFVCVSDTHNRVEEIRDQIPDGDVFLHCGDFTHYGTYEEVEKFNTFLGTLLHRHKIVIAGNHELTFDENILPLTGTVESHFRMTQEKLTKNRDYLITHELTHMSQLLTNCTYLQDSETSVYGLRIYGSPWQPAFCSWAFNLHHRRDLKNVWDLIPSGIDILMTHGPPRGRGDFADNFLQVGCPELLSTIHNRVRPKYHIFGHIHEARYWGDKGLSTDGITTFINACILDRIYNAAFQPVIFDVQLPYGQEKTHKN